jgi:ligand-binding SRPBCC domain-containing protein
MNAGVFSSPRNLQKITPTDMVLKSQIMMVNQSIQAIIQYKSTYFGIINLMTVITAVKENSYFIDEQRFGPHVLYKPFFLKLLKTV